MKSSRIAAARSRRSGGALRRRAAPGRAARRGAAPARRRCPGAARRRRGRRGAASTSALPPRCSGMRRRVGDRAGRLALRRRRRTRPARRPATASQSKRKVRRLVVPRYWLRATTSWPGIAALLEVDAADELEVDHLRHEAIDRRRLDRDDAALAPRASARSRGSAAARAADVGLGAGAAQRAARAAVPAASGRRITGARRRGRASARQRRRPASRVAAAPGHAHRADLGAGVARACTWRAARTSTGASASARARWPGTRAGTRRRPAARRRSWPAGGPWPSRSRPAAPDPRPSVATSLVSWLCRNVAASAPRARITPQSARRQAPLDGDRRRGMRHYHQPPWSRVAQGLERSTRSVCAPMRVWRFLFLLLRARRGGGGVCGLRGGCTRRCRWPPSPSSCRSSPAGRRARSPRPGCGPACRRQPLLLYEWFRWSGQARQIRAGSYEIGAGTTPIAPARQDGARRRDARRRALHRRLDLPPDPRRARARRGAEADAPPR